MHNAVHYEVRAKWCLNTLSCDSRAINPFLLIIELLQNCKEWYLKIGPSKICALPLGIAVRMQWPLLMYFLLFLSQSNTFSLKRFFRVLNIQFSKIVLAQIFIPLTFQLNTLHSSIHHKIWPSEETLVKHISELLQAIFPANAQPLLFQ